MAVHLGSSAVFSGLHFRIERSLVEKVTRERQLGNLVGIHRLHNLWRHHDQKLGIGLIRRSASKELPQKRNVPEPGNLGDGFDQAVVDEAGNRKTLAVPQFNLGLRPACVRLQGRQSRQR